VVFHEGVCGNENHRHHGSQGRIAQGDCQEVGNCDKIVVYEYFAKKSEKNFAGSEINRNFANPIIINS
jgi:hypothetical protein